MNSIFNVSINCLVLLVLVVTSCCTTKLAKTAHKADNVREIISSLSRMAPGDTLVIDEGIYNVALFNAIPSGNNWDEPVVLRAIKSRKVILRPKTGGRVANFAKGFRSKNPAHFIQLEGLVLDAKHLESDVVKIAGGAHHIRLIDCEIINGKNQGVMIASEGSDYNEFISCEIHDNGTDIHDHGIYVSTDYNLIDSCAIYNNTSCGINLYNGKGSVDYNRVTNCHVYNNATSKKRGTGITSYVGVGNIIENNLVQNNKYGIRVDYGAKDITVTNNVIFDNSGWQLLVGKGASSVKLRDNKVYSLENKTSIRVDGDHNRSISVEHQDSYSRNELLNFAKAKKKRKSISTKNQHN